MKKEIATPIHDRKRSGYVRSFKTFDVFLFNIMGFSLGLALCTNPAYIGVFAPNAELLIVILLGALLAFMNGLNYGWFSAVMPSTGGDYVFVSRSLNPTLGFLTSWGFTLCQLYGLAANITWILSMALIPALKTSPFISSFIDAQYFAETMSGLWLFFGSIIIAFLYWCISLLGANYKKVFMVILFIFALCGPLLIAWALYTHTNSDFQQAFNKFAGMDNAYKYVLSVAKESLHVEASPDINVVLKDSIKAIPLGFLCFIGFTYSVYAGGEVSKPEKSQINGIILALLVGVLTFTLCMGRYVTVVGQEFHAAIGYPEVLNTLHLETCPMNMIAGMLIDDPRLNLLMHISIIIWFLFVPYVMFQVCTRNLIAWTCDGLFPSNLLKRNRYNAPWVASLIVCVFVIFIIFMIYITRVSLVGAVALAAVAYLFSGLGAIFLKKTAPDIYEKLPKGARRKFLDTISYFTLVGFVCVIGFVYIIYSAFKYPDISNGTTFMAIIMIIAVYLSGYLIYYFCRKKLDNSLKRENGEKIIDIFAEIPND